MSDISNVLRKVIELDISLGLDGTQEALDEITRLTAEVEKLNSELTDALTDLATARQDNASFMPILNRLTAENEKLRAALELFECDCEGEELCFNTDNCRNFIARATLSGGKQ